MAHPLLAPETCRLIETAVSDHLGHPWRIESDTDLAARASHPAAVLRGAGFAVFAKLADRSETTTGVGDQAATE